MDPALIAQLIISATQLASQVIPLLSTNDQNQLSTAIEALNKQVDDLHANRESVG